MSDNTLKCYRCGQTYPVTDMRYTQSNKLVCKNCLNKANPNKAQMPETKEQKLASREENVEYVCSKCKYSFKRKASAAVGACPYCGRAGTLELKSNQGAANLIDESMDKRYDF
ncbi:MAG: hypothetical protein V1859_09245 [archaeon]